MLSAALYYFKYTYKKQSKDSWKVMMLIFRICSTSNFLHLISHSSSRIVNVMVYNVSVSSSQKMLFDGMKTEITTVTADSCRLDKGHCVLMNHAVN